MHWVSATGLSFSQPQFTQLGNGLPHAHLCGLRTGPTALGLDLGEVAKKTAVFVASLPAGRRKRPPASPWGSAPGELFNPRLRGETKPGKDPGPESSRNHGAECPGTCAPLPTPLSTGRGVP